MGLFPLENHRDIFFQKAILKSILKKSS